MATGEITKRGVYRPDGRAMIEGTTKILTHVHAARAANRFVIPSRKPTAVENAGAVGCSLGRTVDALSKPASREIAFADGFRFTCPGANSRAVSFEAIAFPRRSPLQLTKPPDTTHQVVEQWFHVNDVHFAPQMGENVRVQPV
jgi:hypothetical protein